MRIGLVLLPEDDVGDACVRLARELTRGRAARATLGPDALTHVTLLHVESDEDPRTLWDEARTVLPGRVPLDVLALGLLPYDVPYNAPPAPPATMAWLIIPGTEELRRCEQLALALPAVQRARVTTANGPRFQPHVTLCMWDGEPVPAALPLPRELLGRSGVTCRLALGVIGPNGTYLRTLFEA